MEKAEKLLHVKDLSAYLNTNEGPIRIVDQINLNVGSAETVGLIGETAAGKTVTALSILGILQPLGKGKPLWKIDGEVLLNGVDLLKLPEEKMKAIRGNDISFIPQNPIPSLHPMEMIGYQTGEALDVHQDIQMSRLRKMVVDYLGKVELSDAQKRYHHFRDQFSGGEGQRILIAMALIRNPSLLIADEPTSALDVTVQRQVLQLLKAVKKHFGLSMLLITHDLGVIAEMCDYVYVMYAGKIMEHSDVVTIFKNPKHPYTRGLLAATPRIDLEKGLFEFEGIPGASPDPHTRMSIQGCIFHPRCRYAKPICHEEASQLVEIKPGHSVACSRVHEI
jgi:peptide/nickel transport system ATP-binding protein